MTANTTWQVRDQMIGFKELVQKELNEEHAIPLVASQFRITWQGGIARGQ
jgi:hypothetical protein